MTTYKISKRNLSPYAWPLQHWAKKEVVSMNLILYGSLATVAYSKSWRALVCNFLDMMLGWVSEIRRFTRNRENLGEKWRVESPFFFSGVVVSNHYWFTACPFQQIGICNDLQSLRFPGG